MDVARSPVIRRLLYFGTTRRRAMGVLASLSVTEALGTSRTHTRGHRLASSPVSATPEQAPSLAAYLGAISLRLAATSLSRDGTTHNPNDPWSASTAAGVAVAADGTLYVIDAKADQLRVFAGDGARMQTWGERGDEPGQFQFAQSIYAWGDLAIGPNGVLYIVDPFNSRIQVLDQDGTFLWAWGERGSQEGQFDKPTGIGIDRAGRVYVTEVGNRRLQIFDREGRFLAIWNPSKAEGGPFQGPTDVAVSTLGIVAVTDTDRHLVYRFTAEGAVIDALGAPWGAGVSLLAVGHHHGCRRPPLRGNKPTDPRV